MHSSWFYFSQFPVCSIIKSCPTDSLWPCGLGATRLHCRIVQGIILEWVGIFSPRGSSWPRDGTHLLHWQAECYHWATWEAPPKSPSPTSPSRALQPCVISGPPVGGACREWDSYQGSVSGVSVAFTPFFSQPLSQGSAAGCIKHFNRRVC